MAASVVCASSSSSVRVRFGLVWSPRLHYELLKGKDPLLISGTYIFTCYGLSARQFLIE